MRELFLRERANEEEEKGLHPLIGHAKGALGGRACTVKAHAESLTPMHVTKNSNHSASQVCQVCSAFEILSKTLTHAEVTVQCTEVRESTPTKRSSQNRTPGAMRALPPARLSIPAAAPQAFPPRCTLLLTATSPPTTRGTPRRALLRSAAALAPLLLSTLLPLPPPAWAFENRLPPDEVELKYKSPRTAGPKPTDLGPQPNGGLKPCVDGKPVL